MLDLFNQGGPLFMSLITLEALGVLIAFLYGLSKGHTLAQPKLVRHLGLLAFVTGILGQTIGLYEAMKGIEMMGGVSASMLAGGLKVSFICNLYGMLVFLISLLLELILKVKK
jgi:hypothetical protein